MSKKVCNAEACPFFLPGTLLLACRHFAFITWTGIAFARSHKEARLGQEMAAIASISQGKDLQVDLLGDRGLGEGGGEWTYES
jgi:hypothetical protein